MRLRIFRAIPLCLALLLMVAACTDASRQTAGCRGDYLLNASGEIARVGVEEFHGLGVWADSTDITLGADEINSTAAHFNDELDAIEKKIAARRGQPCFGLDNASIADDRRASDELTRVRRQIADHRDILLARSQVPQ